jgi:CRISPR/Cas system-associated protein Cas5 (RAMP superfamily)
MLIEHEEYNEKKKWSDNELKKIVREVITNSFPLYWKTSWMYEFFKDVYYSYNFSYFNLLNIFLLFNFTINILFIW